MRFLSSLIVLLVTAFATVATARCEGTDLIATLPAPERAEVAAAADRQPFARGNLWRATRGSETLILVGTYHLSDPRHGDLAGRLEPHLQPGARLLVEAGPDEELKLKTELLRRPDFMFLTEGPTLPELLGEADWQAVAAEMRARGVPPFFASKFRPWYMAMMLGIPPCALDSVQAGEKGLDHQLITLAQERGLVVQALEPFDTLFAIFGGLPMEDEIDLIRAALLLADRPEDMTVTLANAYFEGRAREVWEFSLRQSLAVASEDAAAVRRQFALMETTLMTTRNRAWIPVLRKAAAEGPVVAAFGALHLSGADGVLALLAAEGYSLQPLD